MTTNDDEINEKIESVIRYVILAYVFGLNSPPNQFKIANEITQELKLVFCNKKDRDLIFIASVPRMGDPDESTLIGTVYWGYEEEAHPHEIEYTVKNSSISFSHTEHVVPPKKLPPRWYHASHIVIEKEDRRIRRPDKYWTWSEDCKCYYLHDWHRVPESYCLGDRMIYAHYGKDSYGILWRGSSSDNWGGRNFGYDLGKAIRWVQEANHADVGAYLWSKDDE